MNLDLFQSFLWLRWRLFVNRFTRGGSANIIILVLLGVIAVPTVLGLLLGAFSVGFFAMEARSSTVHLLVWDGLTLSFLFFWLMGLMVELQREESLSLSKFLHFPVSLSGIFVLNYLSSLVNISLLIFVPIFVGFTLGVTLAQGPLYLFSLFPLATFLFMITALTYQFQGWLASLMTNPRRRRTIIVFVTLFFILIAQAPNLINILQPWNTTNESNDRMREEMNAATNEFNAGKIKLEEMLQRKIDIGKKLTQSNIDRDHQLWAQIQDYAWVLNGVLPIGWTPYGAASLSDGNPLPALLATLVQAGIGWLSIARAYKTTLLMYLGTFTAGNAVAPALPSTAPPLPLAPEDKETMVAWNIPGITDQAAAVALATLRSLLRAPESKMMLLTPIMILVIFGAMLFRGTSSFPPDARVLIGIAAVGIAILTAGQICANQFSLDRDGYRAYVLSPCPRREILLGKNLALVPIILAISLPIMIAAEIFYPMRIDHLLSLPFIYVSMFVIFALVGNIASISAPVALSKGTMKPANVKLLRVLLQMLISLVQMMLLSVVLIPLGIEALLAYLLELDRWPIALPLEIILSGLMLFAYRWLIGVQGDWLLSRELRILEEITTKTQ